MAHRASTPEPLFSVNHAALYFPPPHTRNILNTVQLRNTGSNSVLVKLKTLTPDRYWARPRYAVVNPGASLEILIALKATTEENVRDVEGQKFVLEAKMVPPGPSSGDLQKDYQNATARGGRTFTATLPCLFSSAVPPTAQVTFPLTLGGTSNASGEAAVSGMSSSSLGEAKATLEDLQARENAAFSEISALRQDELPKQESAVANARAKERTMVASTLSHQAAITKSKTSLSKKKIRLSVAVCLILCSYIAGLLIRAQP